MWFKKWSVSKDGIKEYWHATDAVSRPLAILMSLAIFVVCIAVFFSLFFGGRWLYHVIWGKSNQPPAAAPTAQTTKPIASSAKTNTQASSQTNNMTISTTQPTTTPNTGQSTPGLVFIFLGTSATGAVVYQTIIRRKLKTGFINK
ncbi:MAG TPA: hypothetical protein VMR51_00280 [Patescibacteria group bacterium]|nr:hypothetical protein [Patescibacteria group bacterium]